MDRRTPLSIAPIAVATTGTPAKSISADTAVKMKASGFYGTPNDLDVVEKLMLKVIRHAACATSG